MVSASAEGLQVQFQPGCGQLALRQLQLVMVLRKAAECRRPLLQLGSLASRASLYSMLSRQTGLQAPPSGRSGTLWRRALPRGRQYTLPFAGMSLRRYWPELRLDHQTHGSGCCTLICMQRPAFMHLA